MAIREFLIVTVCVSVPTREDSKVSVNKFDTLRNQRFNLFKLIEPATNDHLLFHILRLSDHPSTIVFLWSSADTEPLYV